MEHGRIIAGIDLGADTAKVAAYAAYFAKAAGASVSLLYVLDYLMTPPPYLVSYIEDEKKMEEEALSQWCDLLGKTGVTADCLVIMGRLLESFRSAVSDLSADLLVLGYVSHLIRPSSSARLIRSLRMPMLVVRGKRAEKVSPGKVTIRKILCPVDFSVNAAHALRAAESYASLFSAELRIVHVIPSHRLRKKWLDSDTLLTAEIPGFDAEMRSGAEAGIERLLKNAAANCTAGVCHGEPAETICSTADDGEYDLIVLGARGLSYLEGILIGSTTEAVLASSPCPVLIVH